MWADNFVSSLCVCVCVCVCVFTPVCVQSNMRQQAKPSPSLNTTFTPSVTVKPSKFLEYLERREADVSATATKLFSPSPDKRATSQQQQQQQQPAEQSSPLERSNRGHDDETRQRQPNGGPDGDGIMQTPSIAATRMAGTPGFALGHGGGMNQSSMNATSMSMSLDQSRWPAGGDGFDAGREWTCVIKGFEFSCPEEPNGLAMPPRAYSPLLPHLLRLRVVPPTHACLLACDTRSKFLHGKKMRRRCTPLT